MPTVTRQLVHHPDLLWALLDTSPRRARQVAEAELYSGLTRFIPAPFEMRRCTWMSEAEHELAVTAYVGGNAAYWVIPTADASPRSFLREAIDRGVHLRAAMTRAGMWAAHNQPIDEFVVLAVEDAPTADPDVATYALGPLLWALGERDYQRGLAALTRAVRASWPGWSALGVQSLELPSLAESS